MSFNDLVELAVAFEYQRLGTAPTKEAMEQRIRSFVNTPDLTVLTDKPRIILGAEDFSPEITATVLWLRSFGLDISCIRLRPYNVAGQLVMESSVLIPLPEAREFQIRRENKEAQQAAPRERELIEPAQFLVLVNDDVRPVLSHIRDWVLNHPDIDEKAFQTLLSYRRSSNREWITWLQFTRWEARVAVRPEVDIDPTLYVRKSSGGWAIVRARNLEEAVQVEALLEHSMRLQGPVSSQDHDRAFQSRL